MELECELEVTDAMMNSDDRLEKGIVCLLVELTACLLLHGMGHTAATHMAINIE